MKGWYWSGSVIVPAAMYCGSAKYNDNVVFTVTVAPLVPKMYSSTILGVPTSLASQ